MQSIVANHEPHVICMCEVGTANDQLSASMMRDVARTCFDAWHATGPPDLEVEYEVGVAYMTIWDRASIKCGRFRTLRSLKEAGPTTGNYQRLETKGQTFVA